MLSSKLLTNASFNSINNNSYSYLLSTLIVPHISITNTNNQIHLQQLCYSKKTKINDNGLPLFYRRIKSFIGLGTLVLTFIAGGEIYRIYDKKQHDAIIKEIKNLYPSNNNNQNMNIRQDEYKTYVFGKIVYLTYDELKTHLNECPDHLELIDFMARRLALIAIGSDAQVFKLSGYKYDLDFQLDAIKANPEVILYLDSLIDSNNQDTLIAAIISTLRQHPDLIINIKYSTIKYLYDRQYNLWDIAIAKDWSLIKYCPVEFQSIETCRKAYNVNSEAIDFIRDINIQNALKGELRIVQ